MRDILKPKRVKRKEQKEQSLFFTLADSLPQSHDSGLPVYLENDIVTSNALVRGTNEMTLKFYYIQVSAKMLDGGGACLLFQHSGR